jgi:transcriptional regulator with XRE-family HTH domain
VADNLPIRETLVMVIAAHFEEEEGPAGRPREPRRKLQLEAQGALPSGDASSVLIHDISATGMLIESPTELTIDERIAVELPHAGATWAKVVWLSGKLFGCEFDRPISAGALSAAQLRSAVGRPVDISHHLEPVADASFGNRLMRLRKERGISQAHVATQLGVSKPTVWAWEHGKARPVGSRIAALAEVLGVASGDLMSPGTSNVDELIARSRQQIAAAMGTSPEKVRIWVEL